MTSIDEIFKSAGSSSGNKRKLESGPNPTEIYKAAKLSSNGDVKQQYNGATVEDDDDGIAGPALPGSDDEDSDEEGRFFGGGVNRDTADMLDYVNDREEGLAAPEKIDVAWLRRLALSLEKKISKNAELRAKFEEDPQKFMASEGDLDAEVKGLSVLTDHPELYTEFARLGCVNSVVSLLAHDNTDIAIDAVQILAELTDEDVQAEQEQWDAVAESMIDADLPSLLVSNMERLDETLEADRDGIYHSLSLVENLASQITSAEKLVAASTILSWLSTRIQSQERPISQNKQYAAEVLAIILQSSEKNRNEATGMELVDKLLELLSAYRRRDPEKDSEEEEYAENLFDCLACLVDDATGKSKFVEAEGVELCLLMLKEGKFSKPRALRVLDHAVGGRNGQQVCEKVVEAAGLKTLFTLFMKQSDRQNLEHLLGIFASMLRLLPGDSPPRIRTLAKFLEKEYEKITKLTKLRREYARRLEPVNAQIEEERQAASEDELEELADKWLSRRLDGGLFSLQTIDVVLAWLAAEDGGARKKIEALLQGAGESLDDVRATLQEQITELEGPGRPSGDEADGPELEMLKTLAEFVR